MIFFARKIFLITTILRITAAAAALIAMAYGIYLAVYGSYVMGAAWIVGSIFFGWASNMMFGLVALLVASMLMPSVRR